MYSSTVSSFSSSFRKCFYFSSFSSLSSILASSVRLPYGKNYKNLIINSNNKNVFFRNFSSSGGLVRPPASFPVLKNSHTLWRWGAGGGQSYSLGGGGGTGGADTKMPTKIEGFTDVLVEDVACGLDHAAFIADGRLYTYGSNAYNQLGLPNEKLKGTLIPHEVELPEGVRIVGVACGAYHTAAIDKEGILYTWGWGGSFLSGAGGLGTGNKMSLAKPTPVQSFIELQDPVVQVACGLQHTLVLTESNRIYSTGRGEFGRLGRGNNGDQLYFEEINFFSSLDPPKTFVKIDCGASHSTALTEDGEVWVWGRNDYGQLGLEDSMGDLYSNEMYPRITRTFELENIKVADTSCADFHMLATTTAGMVYFWGARLWLTPKPVSLPPSYKNSDIKHQMIKVAGGGSGQHYSMAISENGDLYTWGKPGSTCLAREVHRDANEPTALPDSLFDGQKVVGVACGRHRVLAVTAPKAE